MHLFYNLGIALFDLAVSLAAPFSKRAALLVKGRKTVWDTLGGVSLEGDVIWVHCASLGEFEQGRPLIEAIRKKNPSYKIVLSFYSPSGYEVRKNYKEADVVCYLPSDTRANAKRFISTVNPRMVFFVKYEYWYNYFRELKEVGTPLYLVSAIFRKDQIFFKWYGGWFRKILNNVKCFYIQDEKSAALLDGIGIKAYIVAGDTRFDRVAAIAAAANPIPVVENFATGAKVLVAGSTWPADEQIIASYINNSAKDVKLIIAPHMVDESHVQQLERRFALPVCRYTKVKGEIGADVRVLIIDTIGLLSAIYRYGSVAYLGGGFGKGIHNTLEAATYGMPVIFGPRHLKFKEAIDLKEKGAGFSINDSVEFGNLMERLWDDENKDYLKKSGEAALEYVQSMCGATEEILKLID
ncbi:3-deoxy-D-manno-octulosonic acid transferase [Xiashengella succiniciproducens]|uniref:3-deoxy-D-manno-octulosonic acid transferase n=1 Tax=Xiashengella succiniciproducens TaxID=2949635 RepID=A0A9J6ZPS4_9BACT|nr:glycosyltransferase N-terminal domain-containing protein [Alkaliflexus sp. Ai-910]URW79627.1 3-deoxy-D-manno-octulosonic acid transferase [Alkaliflexus sp. Ai-910]